MRWIMFVDKKEVGKRIYDIRKKYGYSMQKFGELIDGAPKGSVNSWEKGVNLPNNKRLEQIASLGDVSVNELLYGSFQDYVYRLVKEKLGLELPINLLQMFEQYSKSFDYTYGDDIEILRIIKGLMAFNNMVTKETVIFYQPTGYSGSYFEGIIQKEDYSVLVCNAYVEEGKNELHLLPIFEEKKTEENIDFFHAIEKLSIPQKHNYFTSGFLTLGLSLRDSRIIYYGINQRDFSVNIMTYEYNCETDSYEMNDTLDFQINERFYRNIEKEAIYQKYSSKNN